MQGLFWAKKRKKFFGISANSLWLFLCNVLILLQKMLVFRQNFYHVSTLFRQFLPCCKVVKMAFFDVIILLQYKIVSN